VWLTEFVQVVDFSLSLQFTVDIAFDSIVCRPALMRIMTWAMCLMGSRVQSSTGRWILHNAALIFVCLAFHFKPVKNVSSQCNAVHLPHRRKSERRRSYFHSSNQQFLSQPLKYYVNITTLSDNILSWLCLLLCNHALV
jgi:hypothetical protein